MNLNEKVNRYTKYPLKMKTIELPLSQAADLQRYASSSSERLRHFCPQKRNRENCREIKGDEKAKIYLCPTIYKQYELKFNPR